MAVDPFASYQIASFLTWALGVPSLLLVVVQALASLIGLETPKPARLFLVWLAICVVVLTPARYLLFLIAVGFAYPFQSILAFFTTLALSIYIPIVFGLLVLIGVGLPVIATIEIAGLRNSGSTARRLGAAILAPMLCVVGTYLFTLALPLGARTVRWLHPVDVLRATNGPPYYLFKYVSGLGTPLSFPVPPEALPPSQRDVMRLHVASAYMSGTKEAWVVKTAFPELFDRFYASRAKP